jgi:hypothetical protein
VSPTAPESYIWRILLELPGRPLNGQNRNAIGCRLHHLRIRRPPHKNPIDLARIQQKFVSTPFFVFVAWFDVVFSSPSFRPPLSFRSGHPTVQRLAVRQMIFSASIPPADIFALVTAPSAIDNVSTAPHFHPLGHKRVGAGAELLPGRQLVGVHFPPSVPVGRPAIDFFFQVQTIVNSPRRRKRNAETIWCPPPFSPVRLNKR